MISEEYLKQQKELHKSGNYGVSGHKYMLYVKASGYTDILDYGCGKRRLEEALGFSIHNYDPAIRGLDKNNEPHDFVYCGDVLEHVEPEYLDAVLADIKRCIKHEGLLVISTVKAKKNLPDGRNAHLIVNPHEWWEEKLGELFVIKQWTKKDDESLFWVNHGLR